MAKKTKGIKDVKEIDSLLSTTDMQPGVVSLFNQVGTPGIGIGSEEKLENEAEEREANKPAATKRGLSRKYYAYDISRVGFWCRELQDKQFVTQHGPTIITQESGFDAVVADLILCTSDQILECAPKGDIVLDDTGKVKDVKHYFYELSLKRVVDKAYKILSYERAQGAISYFIHCLASPKYMIDGSYQLCSPKGASKAGIAPLVDSNFPGVAFKEVLDGTPNSYNPADYPAPKRLPATKPVGYM